LSFEHVVESPAAAAAAAAGCLASGCGRGVRGCGPWLAVAAAAGAWQWSSYSNDGTRQLRQLTRSVIVWYGRNDKFRNVRTAAVAL
tara:strand:+ start:577 stop:834 length:258 start_codon:yes stop_codon:yes gene_type:complete